MAVSDVERPVTFERGARPEPDTAAAPAAMASEPALAPEKPATPARRSRRPQARKRTPGEPNTSTPAPTTGRQPPAGDRGVEVLASSRTSAHAASAVSFLDSRPALGDGVATWGWQGWASRRLGWRLSPSPRERAHRELVERVTVPFTGVRHVLVASAKGGTGTTTTTFGLAATFGFHRGRGVLAYDDSPTRGTLALRGQRQAQPRTVEDLLAAGGGLDRVGEVSAFLHPQADAHFEVLGSAEDAGLQRPRSAEEYRAVTAVLDTFYQVACIDTGTDVTAPAFTAALGETDVLVVTTGVRWDEVHSALWLLDHLAATGHAELARTAVVVVTVPARGGRALDGVREQLAGRVRAVRGVPFDPVLDTGGQMSLHSVSEGTRQAWLEAAATVADGFVRP